MHQLWLVPRLRRNVNLSSGGQIPALPGQPSLFQSLFISENGITSSIAYEVFNCVHPSVYYHIYKDTGYLIYLRPTILSHDPDAIVKAKHWQGSCRVSFAGLTAREGRHLCSEWQHLLDGLPF